MDYYCDYKRATENFYTAMPLSTDVARMKKQHERLFVFSWLFGLDSEYDVIRCQLLANKDVSSLFDVVTIALSATKESVFTTSNVSDRFVLVSQATSEFGSGYRGGSGGGRHKFRGNCDGKGTGGCGAVFLINHMPFSILQGQTPYYILSSDQSLFPIPPKKGYHCYSLELGKNLVSRDVTFFEHSPFFAGPTPFVSETKSAHDFLIYTGKCHCTHSISSFVSYGHLSHSSRSFVASLDSVSLPKTLMEALSHNGRRTAMEEEMLALATKDAWDIVSLPSGKQAIGCKWMYAIKMNLDVTIARLKAQLVAKGSATHYCPSHQLDVKNAFLHGDVQEKVYMVQPPVFVAQGEFGKVCRLRKSLYGLKQSPRTWFGRFSDVVLEFGLLQSSDQQGIHDLEVFLQAKFHMKDLGSLKYFLRIEVTCSKKGISLSQRKYVLDLLKNVGLLKAKPCETPMDPSVKLIAREGKAFADLEKYRWKFGIMEEKAVESGSKV
ncbi:Cysteine-rich RLK (RECEPTOR-like protein kinase) 8 [Theobroma cacao]|uniref:Cysteine-rich RLK (RECEPTOR-like protein kinase) 8 n=1 Tax=Theobroma cacao TaxID=3641 RepID=A0A061GSD6_THECC|nr:Cysteine-rich RLK (RECEPTOR-like protein kinase) 8 [Theobroma cacao]